MKYIRELVEPKMKYIRAYEYKYSGIGTRLRGAGVCIIYIQYNDVMCMGV